MKYLFGAIGVFFMISTAYLFYENSRMSSALLQHSPVIIDKGAFSNLEDSLVSKLGAAATTISVGATVIGFIVAFLSLYTTMNFNKIEERLKNKEAEFDKKYSWINVLPCLLLGNYNQLIKEHVYANKAYEAAVAIDNQNILANYFVGLHYAELYASGNDDKLLDQAKNSILKAAYNFENGNSSRNVAPNMLKVDIYITLGSIYGLLGEKYAKDGIKTEAQKNFYNAKEYLNKAKNLDDSQVKVYVNLGFTYTNLAQYDEAFDNFKLALLKDKESVKPTYTKDNLPWQEKNNDMDSAFKDKLQELEDKHFAA